MATGGPFAFTEEDSNGSIPEIFRYSESDEGNPDEEFYGFTLQDITFGLNSRVSRFHERRDVDRFVDDRGEKENGDPALARGKKRVQRIDR